MCLLHIWVHDYMQTQATHFMHSKELTNKKIKKFLQKGWPVILHLKKPKEQREMPLPSLSPIPSLNSTFLNGMGMWLRPSLNPFHFSEKIFCFLVDNSNIPVVYHKDDNLWQGEEEVCMQGLRWSHLCHPPRGSPPHQDPQLSHPGCTWGAQLCASPLWSQWGSVKEVGGVASMHDLI